MASGIDTRVSELEQKLGEALGPILEGQDLLDMIVHGRIRIAPRYNAIVVEIDGEAWVLSEATVAKDFD